MSTPRSLDHPPGVSPRPLAVARGTLAALVAERPGGEDVGRDGAQGPLPAVLVPGYTGSKEDFLAVLGPLSGGGRTVVAIDQYGQYESDGSDDAAAYGLDVLARDLLDVIASLGGQAHVVGHSFGGFVARAAVGLDDGAGAIRSLTLLGSGGGPISGAKVRGDLALLLGALPEYDLETIWHVKRTYEQELGVAELAPEVDAFLHERFVRTHRVQLAAVAEHLLAEEDVVTGLRGRELPVLVMCGEAEDVWSAAELAMVAQSLGAEFDEIPGAGHSPAVDEPERTADRLAAFWTAAER